MKKAEKIEKIKWKCPKCGAYANDHGRGECHGGYKYCEGFLCDCPGGEALGDLHGETRGDPCRNAECFHCGRAGTFPEPLFDPKKLKGWAKQAYAAGWKPPAGWTP